MLNPDSDQVQSSDKQKEEVEEVKTPPAEAENAKIVGSNVNLNITNNINITNYYPQKD